MDLWNRFTVSDIRTVLTVHSAAGRRAETVNRSSYGLTFSKSGGIVYTQNGKRYESDRTVALLLPMGGTYSLLGTETGEFPLVNFTVAGDLPTGEILRTRIGSPEAYLRDFDRLSEAWLVRGDRAGAMSILYGIFARLSRESMRESCLPIRPAVDYLAAHFSDPDLSCGALAARAGLSEVYFRRLFKEHYGVPPKQYLLDLRIRHAERLLSEDRASVTEIAERCGFSSVYHFCRAFRIATGITPTEHRKKERY